MTQIIIFLLGTIVGGVVVWFLVRKRRMDSRIEGIVTEQMVEKRKNKEKIIELLGGKDQIANSEVEAALGVSDATATRYLDELEKEGVIRQVGRSGPLVYYERIGSRG